MTYATIKFPVYIVFLCLKIMDFVGVKSMFVYLSLSFSLVCIHIAKIKDYFLLFISVCVMFEIERHGTIFF